MRPASLWLVISSRRSLTWFRLARSLQHGIEFGYVGGDPAELMRICVENGMFTVSFIKEGLQKFRDWIDDLLVTSWSACQGTDLIIESPSAMGGLHIAEGLGVPYFRAFTMPWTRTRAYPVRSPSLDLRSDLTAHD